MLIVIQVTHLNFFTVVCAFNSAFIRPNSQINLLKTLTDQYSFKDEWNSADTQDTDKILASCP